MKVMAYNHPKSLIGIAVIGAAIMGFSQPFLGIIFAKVMGLLTVPLELLEVVEGPDYYRDTLDLWVLLTVATSFACLFAVTTRGAAFSTLGNKVTQKIREILYNAILSKHIGFFDERDNNASNLTASMASDTS